MIHYKIIQKWNLGRQQKAKETYEEKVILALQWKSKESWHHACVFKRPDYKLHTWESK